MIRLTLFTVRDIVKLRTRNYCKFIYNIFCEKCEVRQKHNSIINIQRSFYLFNILQIYVSDINFKCQNFCQITQNIK